MSHLSQISQEATYRSGGNLGSWILARSEVWMWTPPLWVLCLWENYIMSPSLSSPELPSEMHYHLPYRLMWRSKACQALKSVWHTIIGNNTLQIFNIWVKWRKSYRRVPVTRMAFLHFPLAGPRQHLPYIWPKGHWLIAPCSSVVRGRCSTVYSTPFLYVGI